MNNDITVLEIMEKTIESLKDNKRAVITIIHNLQQDYAQKTGTGVYVCTADC